MKQNTITVLKKIIEEAVKKEVAKQINIVVQEIVNPGPQQKKLKASQQLRKSQK